MLVFDATKFAKVDAKALSGVAYVAQIEHEYMSINKLTVCNNCFALSFNKPLSRCRGCLLCDYCSKELLALRRISLELTAPRCQKAQWAKHKPFCNMAQGKGKKNAYLTAQARDEVLRILIDAYRLRVELDHLHRGEDHGIYYPGKWEDGILWAKGDAVEDFQRWLDMIERSGILPEWWRFEDRMEMLGMAMDKEDSESIFNPIDQTELITRYGGDTTVRTVLCILAELVVGYEGKGAAKDDTWYMQFSEHLDLHPEERARLIKGSVEAVREVFEKHGKDFLQVDVGGAPRGQR